MNTGRNLKVHPTLSAEPKARVVRGQWKENHYLHYILIEGCWDKGHILVYPEVDIKFAYSDNSVELMTIASPTGLNVILCMTQGILKGEL